MVKFRVGKGLTVTCPACPRTTDVGCLNPLTETDQFTLGDLVYAVYETQCEGNTLGVSGQPYFFVWYQWQPDYPAHPGDYHWVDLFTWTPGNIAPTMVESHYTPPVEGCWKVEYRGLTEIAYSKQFSVGAHEGVTCPAEAGGSLSSTMMWIIIIVIVAAIIGYFLLKRK